MAAIKKKTVRLHAADRPRRCVICLKKAKPREATDILKEDVCIECDLAFAAWYHSPAGKDNCVVSWVTRRVRSMERKRCEYRLMWGRYPTSRAKRE